MTDVDVALGDAMLAAMPDDDVRDAVRAFLAEEQGIANVAVSWAAVEIMLAVVRCHERCRRDGER